MFRVPVTMDVQHFYSPLPTPSANASDHDVNVLFRDVVPTFIFSGNKVRPIRNNQKKKALASGGGFCSALALSIASAARKRGWRGTGAAGGAVTIAEATADLLRSRSIETGGRARLSAITVAPNGFINFAADVAPNSALVSTHGCRICVRSC